MSNPTGTILITGGSGMIGRLLTQRLQKAGYAVRWLVRNPSSAPVPAFRWSVDHGYLDPAAFNGADAIIHLAGENIGGGRWTEARKRQLLESRTRSTALLAKKLKEIPNQINAVLSASAIGYYGDRPDGAIMTEASPSGDDFLAQITREWESAADAMADPGRRVVKVRIGIVLSADGGALNQLARPVKWMFGSPLGSGDQVMSWIHEQDLADIFLHLLQHQDTQGVYNAVAPSPVTNRDLVHAIGKVLRRPILLPPVPAFLLKLLLGEMSVMVLAGCRVSGEKIQEAGYHFRFPELQEALSDIFQKAR